MPILDVFYFPVRSCHQQLKRSFCAIALTALAGGYGFAAQVARLSGLDYQDGLLTITASGRPNPPTVEVWPGNAGPKPTELVILKFPTLNGDSAQLQQSGNSLLQAHPELKKCLIGPLNTQAKGPQGIQIALEVELPSAQTEVGSNTPVVTSNGTQLFIALLPGSARTVAPAAAQSAPVLTATEPSHSQPEKPTKQTPLANKSQAAVQAQALLQANQHQLELEQENTRLKQALEASQIQEDSLRRKLALYEGYIQEYVPGLDEATHPNEVVIQTLKNALTKLANRLKATETALAEEKAKNHLTSAKPTDEKSPLLARKPDSKAIPKTNLLMNVAEQPTAANRPVAQRVYQSASIGAQNQMPASLASASEAKPETKSPDPHEKEMALEMSIRDNPRKYPAYLELADLYTHRADLSAAENILTLLIRQNPAYSMGYYKLALVYVRQHRKAEAQSTLNSYQKLKPNDTQGIQFIQQAIQQGLLTSSSPPVIGPPNPSHFKDIQKF